MKHKIRYGRTMIFLVMMIAIASCKKDNLYSHYQPSDNYQGSIYDYLKSQAGVFDSVLLVLQKGGLTDWLKSDTVTFFAPTDQSLLAAMDAYNVYRQSQGLARVSLNDIDSTSWRMILGQYIILGKWKTADLKGQDGLTLKAAVMRWMHGQVIAQSASGAVGVGPATIQFSYMNGSNFTRDWLSALVVTPDIQATNGVIQILEPRHVLGFNYFIDKAKKLQNLYSEEKTYASGTATLPDASVRIWINRLKTLTAVDSNTVEAEAADMLGSGYLMRLEIQADDSVKVSADPSSANATLANDGPCYFDPVTLSFVLNYSYTDDDGYQVINETIQYISTNL